MLQRRAVWLVFCIRKTGGGVGRVARSPSGVDEGAEESKAGKSLGLGKRQHGETQSSAPEGAGS